MTAASTYLHNTLNSLLTEPGKPRLTWYGADYERIELSGAVLGNWVNKTTNLLTEEFDAEPSVIVTLDIPPHWRFLTWALAALRSGATVALAPAGSTDLVVTDSPERHKDADELVVVTLNALARKFPGELPPGAIDAASAVMTYSDGLGFVQSTDPSEVAIASTGANVTYADLPDWAGSALESTGDRTLLRCESTDSSVTVDLLRNALGIWHAGGSVVLLGAEIISELADDSARFQRIVESEKVTDVIALG